VSGDVSIETVRDRLGAELVGMLFDDVWGVKNMVPTELIIAVTHTGGYASVARRDGGVVGAAFGFLAHYHAGRASLHSHATGVLARAANDGVGEALKVHQWQWASERGLDAVTWTFDPLVRRNAYFNLVKLGAVVTGYHEDFYGTIHDGINAQERTDRLMVSWGVGDVMPRGHHADVDGSVERIDTPDDIETLRLGDRRAAHEWRERQRGQLRRCFDSGRTIVGLDREGRYVTGVAS
jgi:predicted GNAT superfamily acetyltransferase